MSDNHPLLMLARAEYKKNPNTTNLLWLHIEKLRLSPDPADQAMKEWIENHLRRQNQRAGWADIDPKDTTRLAYVNWMSSWLENRIKRGLPCSVNGAAGALHRMLNTVIPELAKISVPNLRKYYKESGLPIELMKKIHNPHLPSD